MPCTDDTTSSGKLVPVKPSHITRLGLILGLSPLQMITLSAGGASLIRPQYAGSILVSYSAPIWAGTILLT